ncbi:MAG TPA: HAD-IIIA family hydrolase [Acidimicrobiia bacterium]|nr:HAD-IIIA family hydrolase [Acidimicrobiia bacterium]
MTVTVDIVVPTIGRHSLRSLLEALAAQTVLPGRIVLVDDRRVPDGPLPLPPAATTLQLDVVRGGGRGPAAARNAGWRRTDAEWVAFLDDDVLPPADWYAGLLADLETDGGLAASQGRLRVPLPADRRPTDWERNVAGLERAQWATADMAYRRSVLEAVGGFDERFPRAYREDADLGLRVVRAGGRITFGRREVCHPVRPVDRWVSVRLQRGNADDVLMRALHGREWRRDAGVPPGRRTRHVAVTLAGFTAAAAGSAAMVSRRRWPSVLSAFSAMGWVAGTAEFAWARIAPGPRTGPEVTTMLLTSAVLPAAATWHTVAGLARLPRLLRRGGPVRASAGGASIEPPAAVLLDRDGTLIRDVPYNGDPERVVPMPGARDALDRLRAAGVPTAVVSNQSGVGRGLISRAAVEAVNRRVEELLGPLGPWLVCFHGPAEGCECRKPAPGLVLRAAAALGVDPRRCAVVGDIGADVEAARACGARAILVPTTVTRPEEIAAAPEVSTDLGAAVDRLLGAR